MRGKLKWIWDNFGNFATIGGWIAGSVLLAWGVKVAGLFVQYQPLSWIVALFVGALVGGLAILLFGIGRILNVQAKFRQALVRESDAIDPMQAIFQKKRIRIADMANPFEQVVKNKKFIDCEIVGPANLVPLLGGGKFVGNNFTLTDTVAFRRGAVPNNAIFFVNCDFENCEFYKVTLLFISDQRENADQMIANMNWITEDPPIVEVPRKASPPFSELLKRSLSDTK